MIFILRNWDALYEYYNSNITIVIFLLYNSCISHKHYRNDTTWMIFSLRDWRAVHKTAEEKYLFHDSQSVRAVQVVLVLWAKILHLQKSQH